jgi:hypothetical protein
VKDVLDELAAVRRVMGKGSVPAGEAYTVELRRRYDAEIDDVWDAITSPERLHRWLKPVTGDLRLGGRTGSRMVSTARSCAASHRGC